MRGSTLPICLPTSTIFVGSAVVSYLIIRPTKDELRERLRESQHRQRLDRRLYRGELRTTEEAFEVQRRLEREGEPFDKPFAISNDSREAKQAEAEVKLRAGINPETDEPLKKR